MHQQQVVGCAKAEGDIQRTPFVFGHRPTEIREQKEAQRTNECRRRSAVHMAAGCSVDRVGLFLGPHNLLLLLQVAATGPNVHVDVPTGVCHAGGHNVLQRRVADRF